MTNGLKRNFEVLEYWKHGHERKLEASSFLSWFSTDITYEFLSYAQVKSVLYKNGSNLALSQI